MTKTTLLPELPEGHFWRVGAGEGSAPMFDWTTYGFGVSLQRKTRFGSKCIERSAIIDHSDAAVATAALQIWTKIQAGIARTNKIEQLSGDYPPKVL